jgi:hypothetical protein
VNARIWGKGVPPKLQFTWAGLIAVLLGASSSAQDFRSPLVLSPYSLSYGEVLIGRASDPQAVTLLNKGPVDVQINTVDVAGNFNQTNDCPRPPATLAKNQTCAIQVIFKPSSPGPASGALTVSHDSSSSPLTVALSGIGTLDVPVVVISPPALEFPDQRVGSPSWPQTIIMANVGKKAVLVSNVDVDGDFTIMPTSTCETLQGSLAADSTCTVIVTFTPLGVGKRAGRVTFTLENGPQKVALTGTGKQ